MSNPLMSESMFTQVWVDENDSMTLEGTINKSFVLLGITIASAILVWWYAEFFAALILPIALVAFVFALIIIFAKKTAPYLAPVYAILEWWVLGTVSYLYEQQLPWLVIQSVTLTFWVFLIMLFLYKKKIVQATENFKSGVIAATGSIALIYIIGLFGSLTGMFTVPYIHESGLIWIWFSVVVVWIAALNLILDFDNVEIWVAKKAPKYMEWYTSFSLLVTLIWLYLEILRLLAKMRSR